MRNGQRKAKTCVSVRASDGYALASWRAGEYTVNTGKWINPLVGRDKLVHRHTEVYRSETFSGGDNIKCHINVT